PQDIQMTGRILQKVSRLIVTSWSDVRDANRPRQKVKYVEVKARYQQQTSCLDGRHHCHYPDCAGEKPVSASDRVTQLLEHGQRYQGKQDQCAAAAKQLEVARVHDLEPNKRRNDQN